MPHEKINHGPDRPSLRVVWDQEPWPDWVFIEAHSPITNNLVSVGLTEDDIDKLIAALRRAKRKVAPTPIMVGEVRHQLPDDHPAQKLDDAAIYGYQYGPGRFLRATPAERKAAEPVGPIRIDVQPDVGGFATKVEALVGQIVACNAL